jgi:uncharacterized protein
VRAVLDTNVLASGVLGRRRAESTPGELLRRLQAGDFELALSEFLLDELERTLDGAFFLARLSESDRQDASAIILRRGEIVSISVHVQGVATHPEDDFVLATGLSAGAHVLVTGDKKLQMLGHYQGLRILSPRAFLDLLDSVAEDMPLP